MNNDELIGGQARDFARRANHFGFSETMSSPFCKNILLRAGRKSVH
jgi:hypothetical protein